MCVTKGPLIKFHICSVHCCTLSVCWIQCSRFMCAFLCHYKSTTHCWCLWLCQHLFVVQSSFTHIHMGGMFRRAYRNWVLYNFTCCDSHLHTILSHLWTLVLFFRALPREQKIGIQALLCTLIYQFNVFLLNIKRNLYTLQ